MLDLRLMPIEAVASEEQPTAAVAASDLSVGPLWSRLDVDHDAVAPSGGMRLDSDGVASVDASPGRCVDCHEQIIHPVFVECNPLGEHENA